MSFPASAERNTRNGARRALTVAVTGASGTIGPSLLQRLAASADVGRIRVLGRRETPEINETEKIDFRRVDIRDADAVYAGVSGADVVVHMAFSLYGILLGEDELFATNVQGTATIADAAARAGVRRFVYTSSAAVYGGGGGQSHPLTEDEELHASGRLFYARHKAQAELIVRRSLAATKTELFMFRPCAIVGPHAAGALASRLPVPVAHAGRVLPALAGRAGLRAALPAPQVPLQFVHEDDVAQAIALAACGGGRAGTYNLAGDGWVSGADALRELGFRPLPVPGAAIRAALGLLARVPPLLPVLGWPELVRRPMLVDTERARRELGWRPRFTSVEALRATRAAIGW